MRRIYKMLRPLDNTSVARGRTINLGDSTRSPPAPCLPFSLLPQHPGTAMKTFARLTVVLAATLPATARAADDEGIRFFEQKIRPVLVEQCYRCHSAKARDAKKLRGELL